jgi:hypothetical protein
MKDSRLYLRILRLVANYEEALWERRAHADKPERGADQNTAEAMVGGEADLSPGSPPITEKGQLTLFDFTDCRAEGGAEVET